jgi:hypothetical protein
MRSRRNAAVTAAAMVIVAGPLLALCGCGQSTSPPSHATQLRFPFTGEPVSSLNRVLLRIPPTSNDAERDLRPAKTQQKISGRLRSGETTRQRYAIRGYLSTAAKHGINVLAVLRDALAGRPWMPPIPDPP